MGLGCGTPRSGEIFSEKRGLANDGRRGDLEGIPGRGEIGAWSRGENAILNKPILIPEVDARVVGHVACSLIYDDRGHVELRRLLRGRSRCPRVSHLKLSRVVSR